MRIKFFQNIRLIDCSQRGSSHITFGQISFIELSMQAFVSHVSCLMREMSEKRKGGGGDLGENNKALTHFLRISSAFLREASFPLVSPFPQARLFPLKCLHFVISSS